MSSIHIVYKNFTVTSVTCTALCDVFRKRRTKKRRYVIETRRRSVNETSQTRIGSTETGTDQDLDDPGRDQGRGSALTIALVGTRTETGSPVAGTGNREAGTENREAGTEMKRKRRAKTRNPEVGTENRGAAIESRLAGSGNREAETGNREAGTGNLEAETENQEVETENREAEVRIREVDQHL